MNEVKNQIEQLKTPIIIGIAVLMFIFFGFCDAVGAGGKTINGFQLVFKAEGFGFSRFIGLLLLILPIIAILEKFIDFGMQKSMKASLSAIIFVAAFLLAIILSPALPMGISIAWGTWVYMFLAVVGIIINYLHKIQVK